MTSEVHDTSMSEKGTGLPPIASILGIEPSSSLVPVKSKRREYSDNQFRLMSLYGGGIRNIKLIRGIHRSTIHRYNSISFEKQIQDDLDKALTKISTIPPYQMEAWVKGLRRSISEKPHLSLYIFKPIFDKELSTVTSSSTVHCGILDEGISIEELYAVIYKNNCVYKQKGQSGSESAKLSIEKAKDSKKFSKNKPARSRHDSISLNLSRSSVDMGHVIEWDEKSLFIDCLKLCNVLARFARRHVSAISQSSRKISEERNMTLANDLSPQSVDDRLPSSDSPIYSSKSNEFATPNQPSEAADQQRLSHDTVEAQYESNLPQVDAQDSERVLSLGLAKLYSTLRHMKQYHKHELYLFFTCESHQGGLLDHRGEAIRRLCNYTLQCRLSSEESVALFRHIEKRTDKLTCAYFMKQLHLYSLDCQSCIFPYVSSEDIAKLQKKSSSMTLDGIFRDYQIDCDQQDEVSSLGDTTVGGPRKSITSRPRTKNQSRGNRDDEDVFDSIHATKGRGFNASTRLFALKTGNMSQSVGGSSLYSQLTMRSKSTGVLTRSQQFAAFMDDHEAEDHDENDTLKSMISIRSSFSTHLPISSGHSVHSASKGSTSILRPRSPLLLGRHLKAEDGSYLQRLSAVSKGSVLKSLESDLRRLPLNPKLQVLCYERRWTILSQVIFAMRENRITPSTLVHELKNINSHLRTKNLESRVSMRLDRRIDEDSPGPNCYDPALYSDRQTLRNIFLWLCPDLPYTDLDGLVRSFDIPYMKPSYLQYKRVRTTSADPKALPDDSDEYIPLYVIVAILQTLHELIPQSRHSTQTSSGHSVHSHGTNMNQIQSSMTWDGGDVAGLLLGSAFDTIVALESKPLTVQIQVQVAADDLPPSLAAYSSQNGTVPPTSHAESPDRFLARTLTMSRAQFHSSLSMGALAKRGSLPLLSPPMMKTPQLISSPPINEIPAIENAKTRSESNSSSDLFESITSHEGHQSNVPANRKGSVNKGNSVSYEDLANNSTAMPKKTSCRRYSSKILNRHVVDIILRSISTNHDNDILASLMADYSCKKMKKMLNDTTSFDNSESNQPTGEEMSQNAADIDIDIDHLETFIRLHATPFRSLLEKQAKDIIFAIVNSR